MLTDALGSLVRLVLPEQRLGAVGIVALIDGVSFCALVADETFDSGAILAELDECDATAVIAQHRGHNV